MNSAEDVSLEDLARLLIRLSEKLDQCFGNSCKLGSNGFDEKINKVNVKCSNERKLATVCNGNNNKKRMLRVRPKKKCRPKLILEMVSNSVNYVARLKPRMISTEVVYKI